MKKYLKSILGFVIAMSIVLISSSTGLLVYNIFNSRWVFIAIFCIATVVLISLATKIPYVKEYAKFWLKEEIKWKN